MSLSTIMGKEDFYLMAVEIDDVAYIRWNDSKIATVKNAMKQKNNMSMRDLAQALQAIGVACSHQNVNKILNGAYSIISIEIAMGLCEVLAIPVKDLVKIYVVSAYEGLQVRNDQQPKTD